MLSDSTLRTDYLPAAATASNTLPALSCYISQSTSGPYLLVASEFTYYSLCGIVRDATGAYARMVGQPPGWFGTFVVVY